MTDTSNKAFLGRGWAFPPAASGNSDVATVAYEDDIRQAILLILETDPGERVMRPDFGVGLRDFLFEPLNTTTMALVRHRTEQNLITWEPRINVKDVEVALAPGQLGVLLVTIRYQVRATNTFYNLVYPFYLQESQP
jgi:phage baseplate assembly protein W